MASLNVTRKAKRLVDEGKVVRLRPNIYLVEGDHDTYMVTVLVPTTDELMRLSRTWSCQCDHQGNNACSHALAAAYKQRGYGS